MQNQPDGGSPTGIADLSPVARRGQQRAWNWYDWAMHAFYTSVQAVLFGPYIISVANVAAGCRSGAGSCDGSVSLLGLHIPPGSLPSYLVVGSTVINAFFLPLVGAFVDRSAHKKRGMANFGWAGAAACSLLFFMAGSNWQIGAVGFVLANILGGCSRVAYYAILVEISSEVERDAVSSRGWAFGYLGGALLLVINLIMVLRPEMFGMSTTMAVRLSMLSAAIWWAVFTIIPFVRLHDHEPVHVVAERGSVWQQSFGQLMTTFREMRNYPMTMTFLVAYLFYNDGIQTVLTSASVYGSKQLHFSNSQLITTILLIQFVAFGGALAFGKVAQRVGAYRPILYGVFVWMVIVVLAVFLPAGNLPLFLAVGVAIGIVMGGTQALSRSFFSLMIPRGREGEYFGLYNALERGTSWIGTLVFGLAYQLTSPHSYRPAIFTVIVLFVIGAVFLIRLDPERGIQEAGNRTPAVLET